MSMWIDDHDEWIEPEDSGWGVEATSLPPYQRLLVMIDDTPWMPVAVRHAIRLAAISNAEINFLAAPTIPAAAGMPDMLAITDDLIRGLTQRHQELLGWAADTAADAGIPCCTHLQWGRLPGTITYLADATQCDLIIMGAPAQSGWYRFFQPRIARRVAAQARQPVLVIKEPR